MNQPVKAPRPQAWKYAVLGIALIALVGLMAATRASAIACPFCNATSQTLTEEIDSFDLVVLARLDQPDGPRTPPPQAADVSVPATTFQVIKTLKGADLLEGKKTFDAIYYGKPDAKAVFLVYAKAIPNLEWAAPIPLTPKSLAYVEKLQALPPKGGDRLAFFQDYLTDEEPLLSKDAFDEFARAPYADLHELKPKMQHANLIKWIGDVNTPATNRRLYLTMLGVCGGPADLPMLEEFLRSTDREQKRSLDAMIACYLTIKGDAGMPLIEELYLNNPKIDYTEAHAAVMAVRFLWQESTAVTKPRLLEGTRQLLNRDDLADMVIADLARWEDWSVMDRLVKMFEKSEKSADWLRMPIFVYLDACAKRSKEFGPQAKIELARLEKIDPNAAKQARAYAAFGSLLPGNGATRPKPAATDAAAPAGTPPTPAPADSKAPAAPTPPAAGEDTNTSTDVPPGDDGETATPERASQAQRSEPKIDPALILDPSLAISDPDAPVARSNAVPPRQPQLANRKASAGVSNEGAAPAGDAARASLSQQVAWAPPAMAADSLAVGGQGDRTVAKARRSHGAVSAGLLGESIAFADETALADGTGLDGAPGSPRWVYLGGLLAVMLVMLRLFSERQGGA